MATDYQLPARLAYGKTVADGQTRDLRFVFFHCFVRIKFDKKLSQMANFKYTAVNDEGEKTEGVIVAGDRGEAREKLHGLRMSVLILQETEETPEEEEKEYEEAHERLPEEKAEEGMVIFVFEAIDKEGKKVDGTVEAKDSLNALKRLVRDYHFQVTFLCEEGASEGEKARMKGSGLVNLKKELQEKEKIIFAELTEEEKPVIDVLGGENEEAVSPQKKVDKDLISAIDNLTKDADGFLATYHDQVDPYLKLHLKDHIERLLVLRASNNTRHIKKMLISLDKYLTKARERLGLIADKELEDFVERIGIEESEGYIRNYESELRARNMDFLKKIFVFELKNLFRKGKWGLSFKKLLHIGRVFLRLEPSWEKEKKIKEAGRVTDTHHPLWPEIHRFIGVLFL
ncbi:MAG TPA: hypothetical protein ENI70_01555, partial [Candidatus Peregrinibacteria bacterium]|nr:hypothetical protein [Candidatus Peregrinibacteria bacterium]